jgi:hypothetical protein
MDGAQSTNPAWRWKAALDTMTELDDEEFLQLLEQNLGRRWSREWRERAYNLAPWLWSAYLFRGINAREQRMAINDVRKYRADRALRRLTN